MNQHGTELPPFWPCAFCIKKSNLNEAYKQSLNNKLAECWLLTCFKVPSVDSINREVNEGQPEYQ